jgi:hypothetical protein
LLVAGGIDLASVKAAMGHSRIATTERYLHARSANELAEKFTQALAPVEAALCSNWPVPCWSGPRRRPRRDGRASGDDRPHGRRVILDEVTEGHLARRRRQMLAHIPAMLDCISLSDVREDDPMPGRERFYRRDLDGRRWLRVVVDFNESPGYVVTAFVQDHAPRSDL